GAQGFETDVRVTRDGVLALLHDATVGRTTSGRGLLGRMSWVESERLDAGGRYGTGFEGARIPRLDDVLDRYLGKAVICLEVKAPAAAEPLIRLLRDRSVAGRPDLAVTSFSASVVCLIHAALPGLTVGWLVRRLDRRVLAGAAERGFDRLYPKAGSVTSAGVRMAHQGDLEVWAWDIGQRRDLERLGEAGVD